MFLCFNIIIIKKLNIFDYRIYNNLRYLPYSYVSKLPSS